MPKDGSKIEDAEQRRDFIQRFLDDPERTVGVSFFYVQDREIGVGNILLSKEMSIAVTGAAERAGVEAPEWIANTIYQAAMLAMREIIEDHRKGGKPELPVN